MQPSGQTEYQWRTEPEAAVIVAQYLEQFTSELPFASQLAQRMHAESGTRIVDWIDHFSFPDDTHLIERLQDAGFAHTGSLDRARWEHADGLFPLFRVANVSSLRMAVKVESVSDFLFAHHIDVPIHGAPLAALRSAKVASDHARELWVIERHGCNDFEPPSISSDEVAAVLRHQESFLHRRRVFDDPAAGFDHARQLIEKATQDLGVDRTCDLFFAAERRYWQSRNRAARVQKARQDKLGLGWANHDHHTYRSSREHFPSLIGVLEALGFVCRERFYGGAEAGWGAQVLEQAATGIVIFADVDLTPAEVTGDFAHDGLPPRKELGTVGLWCKLHGEAFLQAGLHHLECQFDFAAAREQLDREGIKTMAPFTDFEHLKQAFTEGERWPIDSDRIELALAEGLITAQQAERFRVSGSIGSHLEILERNQGYKGFNQTGISEIIRETDPRHFSESAGT